MQPVPEQERPEPVQELLLVQKDRRRLQEQRGRPVPGLQEQERRPVFLERTGHRPDRPSAFRR